MIPIPGEAHWQLGYVERHNGLATEALRTMIADRQPGSEDEYQELIEALFDGKNRVLRRLGFKPLPGGAWSRPEAGAPAR